MEDRTLHYTGGRYLTDNPEWHEAEAAWKASQVAAMLARHGLKPDSICDIGCGTGGVLANLSQFVDANVKLVGYDIAVLPFDLSPQERRDRIEFVHGTFNADQRVYDLLLALDVFEHVEDCFGFLRRIRSKAPLAIFHIPLDLNVQSLIRSSRLLRARETLGHIHYFTRETALAILEDTGYNVQDAIFTQAYPLQRNRSVRHHLAGAFRNITYRVHSEVAARYLGGFSLLVLAESKD